MTSTELFAAQVRRLGVRASGQHARTKVYYINEVSMYGLVTDDVSVTICEGCPATGEFRHVRLEGDSTTFAHDLMNDLAAIHRRPSRSPR